ncbi:aminoglycoside phosphotransferase family protein [Streptomyces sp. NPDC086519]|uniref:aminoglycoside phosphotransferase family protein n=1 Tax=Streptomyces sp. NPDC086519 TaxID=3154863 RepID=UPI0034457750
MSGRSGTVSDATPGLADPAVPLARTVRLPWNGMPDEVRTAVADRLGSPVIAAEDQSGGFSRGVAARLRCADGSRAFVKAVSREGDPVTLALAEQEAVVATALTPGLGLPAPAFHGRVDHGHWTVLVFDDVAGRIPAVPWREDDLALTLGALTTLTERATPNPIPGLPAWGGTLAQWQGWNRLLDDADPLADVPEWARRNARRLAAAEAEFPAAVAGDTLLHSDLRSDNILIDGGRVTFVDWAWAAQGQDWLDPMTFALCAAVQGHPDPQAVFLAHPAGRAADPAAVDSALAALAGRFVVAARQPATWDTAPIRAFQRAEAATVIRWLRTRTRWR